MNVGGGFISNQRSLITDLFTANKKDNKTRNIHEEEILVNLHVIPKNIRKGNRYALSLLLPPISRHGGRAK